MPHHQAAQPDLLPQGLGNEAESEILNKLKKNKAQAQNGAQISPPSNILSSTRSVSSV